ncbi:MAG: septal ring lytic transglycosylase RlpA family protein [Bacteroidetes bacterium]|jgi:rare lipoprotein A|nr:septal ring lytic transglycosylase RlpA family protein [Bacteroidota bacterium]
MQVQAQTYEGKASFYSDKLHGNETASGEKYDMYSFSAAHLSLPFGTWVRVTNLWNGKSVEVKINDRGPFDKDRIIDISKQAAIELGMVTAGVVDVKVEVLPAKTEEKDPAGAPPAAGAPKEEANHAGTQVRGDGTFKITVSQENGLLGFGVQIGAYSDYLALVKMLEQLQSKGFPDTYINTDVVNGKRVFRIVVGNFQHRVEAEMYLVSLKSKGFEGYVVAHQVSN